MLCKMNSLRQTEKYHKEQQNEHEQQKVSFKTVENINFFFSMLNNLLIREFEQLVYVIKRMHGQALPVFSYKLTNFVCLCDLLNLHALQWSCAKIDRSVFFGASRFPILMKFTLYLILIIYLIFKFLQWFIISLVIT